MTVNATVNCICAVLEFVAVVVTVGITTCI